MKQTVRREGAWLRRAIVFEAVGELALRELPDPTPGPKDVVIEVVAVGICGTDTHVFDGEFESTGFPFFAGHGTWVAPVRRRVSATYFEQYQYMED